MITLVDDEPEKKKRGRRSRLKLDKEEKKEVKQDDQPTPAIESVKKPGMFHSFWFLSHLRLAEA